MNKMIIGIIILMILLACAYVVYHVRHTNVIPVPPNPVVKPTVEMALNIISENSIKEHLAKLVEFDGRDTGTEENNAASKYIGSQLESMGYQVEYQTFDFRGKKTSNVMACLPGQHEDEIVVVGAHYDGQGPNHPSADDNASGTVLVLEIAKACAIFNKKELNHTIVFQLYTGEEYGLIGSNYYCNHPLFPKNNPSIKKHLFMLNLDMVGRMKSATPFNLAMPQDPSPSVKQLIEELSGKYSFAKTITFRGSAGSDHAPFLNAGVPAAFLHTGMHSDYHKSSDTISKLNFDGLTNVAKYGLELTLEVAQASQPLEFNTRGFKPVAIEDLKDHDAVPFFSP